MNSIYDQARQWCAAHPLAPLESSEHRQVRKLVPLPRCLVEWPK